MNSAAYFDAHTHVGLDAACMLHGWWPYACMARQLLDDMDRNRIARAVCFPFTVCSAFDPLEFADRQRLVLLPRRFPYDRENDRLIEEIDRANAAQPGRRLLPFAMFDPAREVTAQVNSLRRLLSRTPGIAGLKTQTTIIQSDILLLLTEALPLMDLAQEHNLPVVLHTAVHPADRWARAGDCLDVAEAFPEVRFNLAHSLRFDELFLRRAAALPNVWIDCSAHLIHCQLARENSPVVASPGRRVEADYAEPAAVLVHIESLLPNRYLWGSDNPYMSWCDDEMAYFRSYADEANLLHALPEEVRQRMAVTAPRAWLGLQENDP